MTPQEISQAFTDELNRTDSETQARDLLNAFQKAIPRYAYNVSAKDYEEGRAILNASPELQIALVIFMVKRKDIGGNLSNVYTGLAARKLPWTAEDIEKLLWTTRNSEVYSFYYGGVLRPVERFVKDGGELTKKSLETLKWMRDLCIKDSSTAEQRKNVARILELLGESSGALPVKGETWSDKALADYAALTPEQQQAWRALFAHALQTDQSKPNAAWRKQGSELVQAVGEDQFDTLVSGWFRVVTSPIVNTVERTSGTYTYHVHENTGSDANVSLLKGLAWLCADRANGSYGKDLARALAKLVDGALKKIPGTGPWGVRAASAGIWALTEMGTMDAVGQLGILKSKTSFRTALNGIESGLEAAAKKAGVTKADLEDMGVPTYGFDMEGKRREAFGDCVVEAQISPVGEISVQWFGANGKPVKSVPADVKKNFAAEWKEFKADMDAAGKTLTAQKIRFDGFYVPMRVWKLSEWQERFAQHPLVRIVALRLIWHFTDGERKQVGLWNDATQMWEDESGQPLQNLHDGVEVRLWHPIGFEVEMVLAWRNRLMERQITQPFKQAYREVYILTEAELRTETYSNRFAGHILKQHQMNTLAALRGWKNQLRLMVDDSYNPATKLLPDDGIRAEFWIEGAGDNYGVDTTEAGTYLYLTTDQVRFYRLDAPENHAHAGGGGYGQGWGAQRKPAAPLPLTDVPALVFSEIMRDVDMFVGVSSVGNDPAWQDGGHDANQRDYWTHYSFGDLSATAQTRRAVLEKLLPRLKIASKCELTDKFLVVRGSIRTYKIHLGSGNILMEPNDQYLCIVESRGVARGEDGTHFLPYEGDQRLALILSKAFLLAEDAKISDETITRQLGKH